MKGLQVHDTVQCVPFLHALRHERRESPFCMQRLIMLMADAIQKADR